MNFQWLGFNPQLRELTKRWWWWLMIKMTTMMTIMMTIKMIKVTTMMTIMMISMITIMITMMRTDKTHRFYPQVCLKMIIWSMVLRKCFNVMLWNWFGCKRVIHAWELFMQKATKFHVELEPIFHARIGQNTKFLENEHWPWMKHY